MRVLIPLLTSLFLAALPGCGGESNWGTLNGTVTLDDQPLKKGTMIFHAEGGEMDGYGTIQAGSFQAMTGSRAGLKAGDYKVTVIDQTIPTMGTDEVAKLLTPEKYAAALTTDLKVTIVPGRNTATFKLTS